MKKCCFLSAMSFYEQGVEKGNFSTLFQPVNHVITEAEGAGQAKIPLAEFCARLKSYNEEEKIAAEQKALPQTA